jgi:hypothetical protein
MAKARSCINEHAGWGPRKPSSAYVYLVVVPQRVQAWRREAEPPDRTIVANRKRL